MKRNKRNWFAFVLFSLSAVLIATGLFATNLLAKILKISVGVLLIVVSGLIQIRSNKNK